MNKKQKIIYRTIENEGGYTDNPQRIDQPTNYGITQPTLDNYNANHPESKFPKVVKQLTLPQAQQIYASEYYDKRRIDDIKNLRIASAVFDMGVMSNFNNVVKLVQKTLNMSMDKNLAIDGKIGNNTIRALNSITPDKIDDFMINLIQNRIAYLRGLSGWNKYGLGWSNRTAKY